ncbi:MAG TPA: hypothetical protein VIU61_21225 [Kofleriaceae bacterium]
MLAEATKPLADASGAGIIDAVLSVVKNGKLVVDSIAGFKTPGTIPTGWGACMDETKGAVEDLKTSFNPIVTRALAIADYPTELTGALKIAAAWDKSEDIIAKAVCRFRKASAACDKLAKDANIAAPAMADMFTGNTFGNCPL